MFEWPPMAVLFAAADATQTAQGVRTDPGTATSSVHKCLRGQGHDQHHRLPPLHRYDRRSPLEEAKKEKEKTKEPERRRTGRAVYQMLRLL
uniref:Putative secreted protein n=1 Tax=Anopheles marajoara TaxID=58244 RepID=A0A2M4CA47_9DIPT